MGGATGCTRIDRRRGGGYSCRTSLHGNQEPRGCPTRVTRLTATLALLTLPATWAAAQEAERWTLLASLNASYSTNVFLTPVAEFGDTIGGGLLSLTYGRTRLDYDVAATGWLYGAAFSDFRTLSGVRGGLGLNGRFSFSPVSRFRITQALAKGFNPRRLYGRGALLPQLDVANSVTYAGWNYEASPSTSLDLSGDLNWLRWTAPSIVDTPQLTADTFPEVVTPPGPEDLEEPPFFEQPDSALFALSQIASEGVLSSNLTLLSTRVGPTLRHDFSERTRGDVGFSYRWSRWEGNRPLGVDFVGRAGLWEVRTALRRQLNPTADLSLRYSFQQGTVFPRTRTHNVTGQFDKTFSKRFRLDGFLGYSASGGEGISSVGTWVGGAGFSLRFRRASLTGRFSRTSYQPLGFGRVIATNFFFASGSWIPAEKWLLSAYAGMTNSSDQLDTTFDYEHQFVGVFASYRISRRFTLGGFYAFRRYQFDPLPSATASVLGASVSYGRVWK